MLVYSLSQDIESPIPSIFARVDSIVYSLEPFKYSLNSISHL